MIALKDTCLVAGGAGFIGSHLCAALLARGRRVICLDNLMTSRPGNLAGLLDRPGFMFVHGDITNELPAIIREQSHRVDRIYNLACAASPPIRSPRWRRCCWPATMKASAPPRR